MADEINMELKRSAPPRLDRLLRADEVVLQVLEVNKAWAKLKLWPKVDAVRSILEEFDRVCSLSYAVRHYACGRALYCGVGVASNTKDELVYRDACAIGSYHLNADPAQNECESSFIAAAALWGVAAPVLQMPAFRFTADKVQINPVATPDGQRIKGYVLADILTCTGLAYEDGKISLAQFTKRNGDKLLWQKH